MKERVFFLVDVIEAAKQLVPDLKRLSIEDTDLHVIASESIDRGEVMIIVDLEPEQEALFTGLMADRHPETLIEHGNLDAA